MNTLYSFCTLETFVLESVGRIGGMVYMGLLYILLCAHVTSQRCSTASLNSGSRDFNTKVSSLNQ